MCDNMNIVRIVFVVDKKQKSKSNFVIPKYRLLIEILTAGLSPAELTNRTQKNKMETKMEMNPLKVFGIAFNDTCRPANEQYRTEKIYHQCKY